MKPEPSVREVNGQDRWKASRPSPTKQRESVGLYGFACGKDEKEKGVGK